MATVSNAPVALEVTRVRQLLEENEDGTVMIRRKRGAHTHEEAAWALHEWRMAWDAVNESPIADEYDAAAELLLAFLGQYDTFAGLLAAFTVPDASLLALTNALCADPSINLEPHLLMSAAWDLRLRALVQERCSSR
jgi:hypothetical protein